MKAILNYWDEDKKGNVTVGKGDFVIAVNSEHNLTEGFEYRIEEVDSANEITVVNDLGEEDIYSVEYFKKSWKVKSKEGYIEVEAHIGVGDSIERKVLTLSEFKKIRDDKSVDIKMAHLFVKSNGVSMNMKLDLNNIEDYS